MKSTLAWEELNNQYLSTMVAWIRLRLQHLIDESQVKDSQLLQASEAVKTAAQECDPPPASWFIADRLGLSIFEHDLLLLCAAMEFDTRIADLCAQAQSDLQRPYPTFALAMALFDSPAWEALSPDRPLRYWHLVEVMPNAMEPLTSSALRADERIVNFLKGLDHVDSRLAPYLFDLERDSLQLDLSPSQQRLADEINIQAAASLASGRPEVLQLLGPDSGSKRAVAAAVGHSFGLTVYRLPAELLPRQAGDLETMARLWQRETMLSPLALYLDAMETEEEKDGSASGADPVRRFISRLAGVIFLDSRYARPRLGRPSLIFDVERPTTAEQQAAWEESAHATIASQLAAQYNLNLAAIQRIGRGVESHDGREPQNDLHEFWDACRRRTRPRLDLLAQRLDPRATWSEIILPEEQISLLHEIADQVYSRSQVYEAWGYSRKMNRGLGISALFAGESGTGKTMAAEVIANELNLDLYRIDLSAVVSKYIGETEKNLRRLFDAAEDGGAILFFDEADALFGKRSEVRDSHDRYANIEINYLLQRMEGYRGLAILATNMKGALDQAFMRRIRFIVNFPFPGEDERRAIWQGIFPAEVPMDKIDFARLARLKLTGGSIHNVGLNAAFRAARLDQPVSIALILAAARTEFRKLDRPFDERDFAAFSLDGVVS
jgi:hypothetical protein